ncbi:hypothetical protein HMPREF0202_01833 [Cetobacterium somerae ATCC BAA-474]|uniref:Uncharacterized protein n=1 Tax=Cetobacterium somerae ATCC BAA-474 TaxID=1319815 RepID=U7VBV6_9FUSO|nr:hypothetical protein [Cetobacterium somerae]ERT68263.1 hypothetical protein HMPREF0202_01833 [Cetobacterium somerae ATCC BAA-474]
MKKIVVFLIAILSISVIEASNIKDKTIEEGVKPLPPLEIPMIPMIPASPNTDTTTDENNNLTEWELEKISTFHLETKVEVLVPLEIISDVEIKALVIDDQKLVIPFELEMNKEPERKNYYGLHYSETEIDIDEDGKVDTKIFSPKYINQKFVKDNYLYIDGSKISKEGVHKKRVYVTVELKEEVR